ncbi:MAG: helix-hairpin-helix domain-containing protein [Acidobacteria bacterium]|nr:helix-hairpin-helix domain-containing protein [Acidobacteriota bacterium]
MRFDPIRLIPRSLLLSISLVAQVPPPPAPAPEAKAPAASSPAPKAAPKAPKGKAKPKATGGNDAQVKREVAVGSKVRSKALKGKKKAPLPPPVDINSATKEELLKLPGITEAYADRIIAKRPYPTKTYLVLRDVLPHALYTSLKGRIAVLPKP